MQAISSAQPQSLLAGSRSSEQLQYRSMQFELALSDSSGRSVTLSLSAESLHFQGSYDRFGMVSGGNGGGRSGMIDSMRQLVGEELAGQLQALRGDGMVMHREEVSLSAESLQLSVDGDVDLLQDYFGAAKTADRIYDFVGKLARKAGIESGSEGFKNMLKDAHKGVQQGFEAVEQALGALPEISKQTRAVLDTMFQQAQADPSGPRPDAVSILEQLLEQTETETDAE